MQGRVEFVPVPAQPVLRPGSLRDEVPAVIHQQLYLPGGPRLAPAAFERRIPVVCALVTTSLVLAARSVMTAVGSPEQPSRSRR